MKFYNWYELVLDLEQPKTSRVQGMVLFITDAKNHCIDMQLMLNDILDTYGLIIIPSIARDCPHGLMYAGLFGDLSNHTVEYTEYDRVVVSGCIQQFRVAIDNGVLFCKTPNPGYSREIVVSSFDGSITHEIRFDRAIPINNEKI